MTAIKKLTVYYHDEVVGYLAETPDHMVAFQYSDSWIRNGFSISPLSLPLNRNVFIPPDKCRERFNGMFGIFSYKETEYFCPSCETIFYKMDFSLFD